MSDEFEQKKRNVINALSGVLRTSALKDEDFGQQRLILLVDQLLDRVGPDGTLPLTPVYEFLKEKQIDEDSILEVLLVFKERASTLEMPLEFPPAVEHIAKDRRQRLLLRYQKRQRAPRSQASAPSEPRAAVSAPTAPSQGGSAARNRTRMLAGVLGLVLVAGAGVLAWQNQTAEPTASAVTIDDPRGLPCKELKGNHGVLMCWMERKKLESLSEAERKTRGLATKAAGTSLGYQSLQVWTVEDTKLRSVY